MTSDGSFLYLTSAAGDPNRAIDRISLADHTVDGAQFTGLAAPGRTGIAVDTEFIYLVNPPNGSIYRVPVSGGAWIQLVIGTFGGNNHSQMAITDTEIICYDSAGNIWVMGIDGSSPVEILNAAGIYMTGLATDGVFVYYGVSQNGTVGRISIGGAGRNDNWWNPATPAFDPMDMAYDPVTGNLYLARFTVGDIVYVNVSAPLVQNIFGLATGAKPVGLCIT